MMRVTVVTLPPFIDVYVLFCFHARARAYALIGKNCLAGTWDSHFLEIQHPQKVVALSGQ